jgi:hypothetical protein
VNPIFRIKYPFGLDLVEDSQKKKDMHPIKLDNYVYIGREEQYIQWIVNVGRSGRGLGYALETLRLHGPGWPWLYFYLPVM